MDKIDYLVRDSLLSGVALQQQCSQFIPLMTQHCKVSEKG
jgi:HD superfamily phosphohydrolase